MAGIPVEKEAIALSNKMTPYIRKLELLRSGQIEKSAKQALIEELIAFSSSLLKEKEQKEILDFLQENGKSLSRDFIPVLAGFILNRELLGYRPTLFDLIHSGTIRIEGKKIFIVKLSELPPKERDLFYDQLFWFLSYSWFNLKTLPDPDSTIFVVPFCTGAAEISDKEREAIERALKQFAEFRKKPGWMELVARSIYPSVLPVLLSDFTPLSIYSEKMAKSMLDCALEAKQKYGEKSCSPERWEDMICRFCEWLSEKEELKKMWQVSPTHKVAEHLVGHGNCDLKLLSGILSTVQFVFEDRKFAGEMLIRKWAKVHQLPFRFFLWLSQCPDVSAKFFSEFVAEKLWSRKLLDRLLHHVKKGRFRKVLLERRKFFLILKRNKVNWRSKVIREGFLKPFSSQNIPVILKMMQFKKKLYQAGAIVSRYTPDKTEINSFQEEPDDNRIFPFFLALITRENQMLVQKGIEAVGDKTLLLKARDSLSLKERVALYHWSEDVAAEQKLLWEEIFCSEVGNEKQRARIKTQLIEHLRLFCQKKKAILKVLDLICRNQKERKNGALLLQTGGCGFKDFNITSASVSCCYFWGGGYEENLLGWLISRRHFVLYLLTEKDRKREYIGVVMAFTADDGKTLVIDSVEGKRGTLRQFPGWQRWLMESLRRSVRNGVVRRIVFNCEVNGDLAKEFTGWVKENETLEKNPASVKLDEVSKNVSMEFTPQKQDSFISVSADEQAKK